MLLSKGALNHLAPIVLVMPAVVVVTIAVPAAAVAVHAITPLVALHVSVPIGVLVAARRTYPMLIAAVGVFPQIALVVVTIALRPVITSAVYTVPIPILISV